MKMPTSEEIEHVILAELEVGTVGEMSLLAINKNKSQKIAKRIKHLFACAATREDDVGEAPKVDPNLITIAELEAKLAVYEAVVHGAGVRLAIPKEKGQIGLIAKKKERCDGEGSE